MQKLRYVYLRFEQMTLQYLICVFKSEQILLKIVKKSIAECSIAKNSGRNLYENNLSCHANFWCKCNT